MDKTTGSQLDLIRTCRRLYLVPLHGRRDRTWAAYADTETGMKVLWPQEDFGDALPCQRCDERRGAYFDAYPWDICRVVQLIRKDLEVLCLAGHCAENAMEYCKTVEN